MYPLSSEGLNREDDEAVYFYTPAFDALNNFSAYTVELYDTVRDALKRSGNRRIIENSPVDAFWGIGPDRTGKNMVGELWMKLRDKF